ncbi:MAG: flagellar basal body rod protein FlgF [Pseudomonadota bacterium]
MDRLLYLSMNGASQMLSAQAVNSHNLANLNTVGFREDLLGFESIQVEGEGLPTRTYSLAEGAGVNLNPGSIITTGRNLDVAINGDGYLTIQARDGTEAYTRAGDLRLGPGGILTTGAGHPVIGDGGPIAIEPAESIDIGTDGTISIKPLGAADEEGLVVVDRLKLVNPDENDLIKSPDGLLRIVGGAPAQADADVRLAPGAVETSNVNAIAAMVSVITYSRTHELNVKMMEVAEESDAASARLLSLSG